MLCSKCPQNENEVDVACISEWGQCVHDALNLNTVSEITKFT